MSSSMHDQVPPDAGRKKLQEFDPTPHRTVETLQEDKEWLSNRKTA